MKHTLQTFAVAAIAALGMAGGATAATVPFASLQESVDGSGNLCAGDAGRGFDNCKLEFDFDEDGTVDFVTPIIGKIEAGGKTEYNFTSFPGLDDGDEELALGGTTSVGGMDYFTATYTVDSDDPVMTHFAIKGGSGYTIYNSVFAEGDGFFELSDNVYTLFYTERNMSNITVWDSPSGGGGLPPVPVPASLPLLLGALGLGGVVLKRRKRKA